MFTQGKPIFDPLANPKAVFYAGKMRFTVLKSRLIRMEYAPDGHFEDRPTQIFWYRNQEVPTFEAYTDGNKFKLETEDLSLTCHLDDELIAHFLEIHIKSTDTMWSFGDIDQANLRGTARTLDRANGRIPLEPGLVSCSGWSLIEDTKSLVFTDEQTLQPRHADPNYHDWYFFGYGHDYLDAIREYQDISGRPGLLPRWALGNWWSRYWAYTQDELTELMLEFKRHEIPLTVCIIDMDWHITQTGNASSGWTGYTWNKNLFHDPAAFLAFLHQNNLKTALNLHPAEGIYPHEEKYPQMAKALGVDPASQQPIPFDIASPNFRQAYLEILHHPLEEQGVDFWWIDWQQGSRSKIEGLDPLFALNHLHYYDLGRTQEKRPFIFSRWPGLGGHRYPIGFSGDTIVSWDSLAFQPEFTATAANVAYGWWSHDIGGHFEGIEEAELYLRWVQWGVFSPIFRLHSTNNPYCERRPWGWGLDTLEIVRKAMQLRRQLIPLLYSANYRNVTSGEPLLLPLYYAWPERPEAYHCPNEYLFCQQLLAAPITIKSDPDTRLARQVVWLPQGDWYDFFTGEYFEGGYWYPLYCDKTEIPVFAKAGAIIPLDHERLANGAENPEAIDLKVFACGESSFSLYEDDGESQDYLDEKYSITKISQKLDENGLTLLISPMQGSFTAMPTSRQWNVEIFGVSEPTSIKAWNGNKIIEASYQYEPDQSKLIIILPFCSTQEELKLKINNITQKKWNAKINDRLSKIIKAARMPTSTKLYLMQFFESNLIDYKWLRAIDGKLTSSQLLAILENLLWKQSDPISSNPNNALLEALMKLRQEF